MTNKKKTTINYRQNTSDLDHLMFEPFEFSFKKNVYKSQSINND